VDSDYSAIGGGRDNTIASNAWYAVIPGGWSNAVGAGATNALAAGYRAKANHRGTFVWADSQNADFASTTNNQFLIRASGGVAIGTNDPAGAMLRVAGMIKADGFLGMGSTLMLGTTDNQPLQFKVNNQVGLRLEYPTVGTVPNLVGGYSGNTVGAGTVGAVIAGGGGIAAANSIGTNASFSAIGGGIINNIASNSRSATIAGGEENTIGVNSTWSAIGGGYENTIASNSLAAIIAGGWGNGIGASCFGVTISGGTFNNIGVNSDSAAIGGGENNNIASNARYAVIPGGTLNVIGAGGTNAFAAGYRARANHTGAFVWADSTDADFASTANNQFLIRASGGMGINTNNPGGAALAVNGAASIHSSSQTPLAVTGSGTGGTWQNLANTSTGGRNWTFISTGSGNGEGAGNLLFRDTTANAVRMVILTNGNVGIGTTNPTNRLMVVNARCDGSSWINSSDRNLKEAFAAVDPLEVLAKVAALPIQSWSYKAQPEQKHLGPVAQDFRAAFGLGQDDTTIATVDADGVALAAIQGLNQKLETSSQESAFRIQKLETENAALKASVAELKQLMEKLIANGASK
jgi:hypothetical protein